MRIIYIFNNDDYNTNAYGRSTGWANANTRYRIGFVLGHILQFIAGVGIGWTVTSLLKLIGLV